MYKSVFIIITYCETLVTLPSGFYDCPFKVQRDNPASFACQIISKGVERVRECETAGRAGVGLARMEDISNPISFERNPSLPTCQEQEVQLINNVPVSRTVYLEFNP